MLVLCEDPGLGTRRLASELDGLSGGAAAMLITPVHPRTDGGEAVSTVWLSRARGGTSPSRLDYDVLSSLTGFLKEHRGDGSVVHIEGLELLEGLCGFNQLARFLKKVCELASGGGVSLIATANPRGLEEGQVSVIRDCFDYVDRGPVGVRIIRPVPGGGPVAGRSYMVRDRDGFNRMRKAVAGVALLLTGERPGRVRDRHGFGGAMVWFTETKADTHDGSVMKLHPSSAPVEGVAAVTRFLSGEGRRTVIVEGLGQLKLFMDFRKLVSFLKSVADACAVEGAGLIVGMDPKNFSGREQVLFHRLVDEVIG